MSKQVFLSLAYVLHSRAYRESSLLVDLLTPEYGKISVIARGAKRGKHKLSGILQPFMLLEISWYGSGDLVLLTAAELVLPLHMLTGRAAICGLYVNELVMRLVPKWDSCVSIFNLYRVVIVSLSGNTPSAQHAAEACWPAWLYDGMHDNTYLLHIVLRLFEKKLLQLLGYALPLLQDYVSKQPVCVDQYYIYEVTHGPKLARQQDLAAISGASLLALATEHLQSPQLLPEVKRLMRQVLSYYLDYRTIKSRTLL